MFGSRLRGASEQLNNLFEAVGVSLHKSRWVRIGFSRSGDWNRCEWWGVIVVTVMDLELHLDHPIVVIVVVVAAGSTSW